MAFQKCNQALVFATKVVASYIREQSQETREPMRNPHTHAGRYIVKYLFFSLHDIEPREVQEARASNSLLFFFFLFAMAVYALFAIRRLHKNTTVQVQ